MGRRLPTGPHGIPADVVARNQRERLIGGMVEVCAERGYAGAKVIDVVKVAGVSSATFYQRFEDKWDCLRASHAQLLERLLEEVDRASERTEDDEARTKAALRSLLSLLAADPPSARLLSVEILAAGPEGAKCHANAVEVIGARLMPGAARDDDSPISPAEWAQVAGILALIGQHVMADEADSLPELEDELVALVAQGA